MTRFVKDATDLDRMKEWARSATSAGDRRDANNAVSCYGYARNPNATDAVKKFYMNWFDRTFDQLRKKLATTPPPSTPT